MHIYASVVITYLTFDRKGRQQINRATPRTYISYVHSSLLTLPVWMSHELVSAYSECFPQRTYVHLHSVWYSTPTALLGIHTLWTSCTQVVWIRTVCKHDSINSVFFFLLVQPGKWHRNAWRDLCPADSVQFLFVCNVSAWRDISPADSEYTTDLLTIRIAYLQRNFCNAAYIDDAPGSRILLLGTPGTLVFDRQWGMARLRQSTSFSPGYI